MGRGIALQFKQAYPAMFRECERACKAREVKLGSVQGFYLGGLVSGPRWIINFPTKGHWCADSRIADIETRLKDLVARYGSCTSARLRFLHWGAETAAWTGTKCVRALKPRWRKCPKWRREMESVTTVTNRNGRS